MWVFVCTCLHTCVWERLHLCPYGTAHYCKTKQYWLSKEHLACVTQYLKRKQEICRRSRCLLLSSKHNTTVSFEFWHPLCTDDRLTHVNQALQFWQTDEKSPSKQSTTQTSLAILEPQAIQILTVPSLLVSLNFSKQEMMSEHRNSPREQSES